MFHVEQQKAGSIGMFHVEQFGWGLFYTQKSGPYLFHVEHLPVKSR